MVGFPASVVGASSAGVVSDVLPVSAYGLSDDSLWRDRGGDVGLVSWLESRYTMKQVMSFVNGELFAGDGVWFSVDDLVGLNTVQDYVVEDTVIEYASGFKFSEELPCVFRWDGELFIFQGTHRLSACLLNGVGSRVWFVDCDLL